jgi:hypothetical protein
MDLDDLGERHPRPLAARRRPRRSYADYASGVKSKIVLKTTVTANGEQIRYPVTTKVGN